MNKLIDLNASQPRSVPRVLLTGSERNELDIYSDLIRDISDCEVDTNSRIDINFEWVSRGNYDLIVMDLETESIGKGLETLERIRRTSPATGIIVLSSQATIEQAVAVMKLGAEEYFGKPFHLETFKLAVKRSFSRKAYLRGNVADQDLSPFLSLLNCCQMISGALEEERIFRVVKSYLAGELGDFQPCFSAIYSYENSKYLRVGTTEQEKASEEILDIAIEATDPANKMKASSVGGHTDFFLFVERGQLTPGLFVFKFRCSGNTEYFCVCLSPKKPGDLGPFETRLRMLRAQIEVTGTYIKQYKGVQQLAYLDDVTGLYNSRYLSTVLDREINQYKNTEKPFAVLFIDADHFKQINDGHGHLVGTRLLNAMGRHLKKYVRETDTVFRYGGDEFIAVLSPCDLVTAKQVAERIRASVERKEFLAAEGLRIKFTVSIGVALFPEHASTKKEIIDAADHAMYGAKKASRNSVFLANKLSKEQA